MARPNTYQTIQGDTWDWISFKLFNNEYYGDQLMAANSAFIQTQTFDQGVLLAVPPIVFPNSVSSVIWGTTYRIA